MLLSETSSSLGQRRNVLKEKQGLGRTGDCPPLKTGVSRLHWKLSVCVFETVSKAW